MDTDGKMIRMRTNLSDYAFAGAASALFSGPARHIRRSAVINREGALRCFSASSAKGLHPSRRRLRSIRGTFCTLPGPSATTPPTATALQVDAVDDGEGAVGEFSVSKEDEGKRLDKVLAARYSQSRSYFHGLIDAHLVSVNGSTDGVCKSRKLHKEDVIRIWFTTPERERPLQPEDIPLIVLYEDEHLAVLNKPAGLVVHPAPGNWTGTLAHGLAHRYAELATESATAVARPGIVHRLDKGTSGALVVARTREAHEGLAALFAARAVRKDYLAVTLGSPGGTGVAAGIIDVPLGRCPTHKLRMAVVSEEEGGRNARSLFEVIGRDSRGLLHVVRVRIETGRTHQIRVHMRHRRAPVLGDNLYGAPDLNKRFKSAATRPMLHALRVAFEHPITGAQIDVSAPIPEDFRTLISHAIDPALLRAHPEW